MLGNGNCRGRLGDSGSIPLPKNPSSRGARSKFNLSRSLGCVFWSISACRASLVQRDSKEIRVHAWFQVGIAEIGARENAELAQQFCSGKTHF